jgi:hypothetical protein
MASLFWTIATSETALWVDGAILLVAAVIGWFPLLRWFPILGTYVPLARFVFVAVLFVTGFCLGYRLADESAALKQAQQDLAFQKLQLDAQKESAETAEKLRDAAQAEVAQANQKVKDYEADLAKEPADSNCYLTDDDLKRLRAIAH